jgi:hypothetical protein
MITQTGGMKSGRRLELSLLFDDSPEESMMLVIVTEQSAFDVNGRMSHSHSWC